MNGDSAHPVSPEIAAFRQGFAAGRHQLVWTRLVVDLETPVSALIKLRDDNTPCFLLESVEGGEVRGRYSIIGLKPDLIWRCFGARAEINRSDMPGDAHFTPLEEDSLTSLRKLLAATRMEIPPELPPMAAGLVGYMSYDMVKEMEHLPSSNPDAIGIPTACFMRPKIMLIFDSVAGVVFIVTPIWHREDQQQADADTAYHAARARIAEVVVRLAGRLPESSYYHTGITSPSPPPQFTSNMTQAEYGQMVERAKEYIAAGDIFQVVLSQRFAAPFTLPHFALYRAIRYMNPSPFLFFLTFGDYSLVGASPEILVRLRDGKVTIRPIAGTRRRGATMEEDAALACELLADPKELAEHLMLLDLGRNDAGRISRIGTVKVTERMVIERYSHVMHIVSNVEGMLDPAHDALDALIAGFPAGTVSGAPKIRAMEIIEELEPVQRSFYGGCVGYFSANGSMDSCITLRTGLIKDNMLYVQAGGGVVADSRAEGEYEESRNKARALMRAAEEALKFSAPPAGTNGMP